MSEAAPSASPEDGVLSTLFELLPAGWRERFGELVDLDPARLEWLGDESARVGRNLLGLLERSWPEIWAIGGRLTLYALAGMLVVGLVAALLGGLLYAISAGPLLRRGWRTGGFIGCVAVTTVVLSAGAGGAWAGLWLGAGWVVEEAIEQRYLVERLGAATFLAFTLEEGEHPQPVDADAVEELLAAAQSRSAEAWNRFRTLAEDAASRVGNARSGWLPPELIVDAVGQLDGDGAPDLTALHALVSAPSEAGETEQLPQTAAIRARAIELVRGTTYTQAGTGLLIGLLLPLGGLTLIGLLGSILQTKDPPPADPGPSAADRSEQI
ncbi:MAG: hypothetical protein R3244_11360 [Thermoanaerobaculia bacterium]|nr:hypothetical protein [Thermoanaerobaculia bacterium]